MKLIDLLKERDLIVRKMKAKPIEEVGVGEGKSDEERRLHKEFESQMKQYHDICNKINEKMATTMINVEGYGELSVTTALGYYADRLDLELPFTHNGDISFDATDLRHDLVFNAAVTEAEKDTEGDIFFPIKDKDCDYETEVNIYYTVMQALCETEV